MDCNDATAALAAHNTEVGVTPDFRCGTTETMPDEFCASLEYDGGDTGGKIQL
jgi:hypothetical protein